MYCKALHADSDWAGCPMTYRSTTGWVFFLAGGPVSWLSKKQSCVALSSTEAEYVALCSAGCESIFLRGVLEELQAPQSASTELFEDNYGCVQLTKDFVHHTRTKHIHIKYHKIKELVADATVRVVQVPTRWQLADFFTKIHGPTMFLRLRRLILGS